MKTIYAEGYCKNNPGYGGWAIYLLYNQQEIKIYGYGGKTTHNQMELKSAIKAAQFIDEQEEAIIYTSSEYVKKGLEEWIENWKNNEWKTSKKKPVINQDLWIELDSLNQRRKIKWVWSKAHNEHEEMLTVSALSELGAKGQSNEYLLQEYMDFVLNKKPIKNYVQEFKLLDRVLFNKDFYFIIEEINNDKGIQGYLLSNMKERVFVSDKTQLTYTTQDETEKFNVIANYKDKLSHIYYDTKHKCHHKIQDSSYGGAECQYCREDFGWFCEESPDHICHYYSNDRKITLIDGTEVSVPEDHNDKYETDDCCIFCGNPEERK